MFIIEKILENLSKEKIKRLEERLELIVGFSEKWSMLLFFMFVLLYILKIGV